MRIKTQLVICIVTFTLVFSIITVSVAVTEQRMDHLSAQKAIVANIERGVSGLNSVSIDYFLYQEDLQLSRWSSSLSFLYRDLANLEVDSSQQQMFANNIASDLQGLNTQFGEVTAYLQDASRNVSVRIDPAFQIRWSSMAVQSQTLVYDASQLSHSIDNQIHQASNTNNLLIVSLVASFGALLVMIYLILFRRTLKSVAALQKGINTIGSGDLNYVIKTQKNDEITELSHAFNQMTAKLKTVTASKAELEKEIAERQKAERTLSQRNKELERLQVKLEEKAAEVEEYASQMETLAEERLKKLRDSERLAAIGATAGMVGHDIRNPLQAINGELYFTKKELLKLPDSPLKERLLENLEAMKSSVTYINKIVQDLQDYARPINITLQEINLDVLCQESLLELPSNVSMSCEVDQEVKKLMSDGVIIKRILSNLISNAVQAMPQGGKLVLRASKDVKDVVITVEDTGVGIPNEVKDKLFTPMFTTKAKGQGFGLVVVKRMTEALRGTIAFESEVGKGTRFIVRLPNS